MRVWLFTVAYKDLSLKRNEGGNFKDRPRAPHKTFHPRPYHQLYRITMLIHWGFYL